MPWGQQLFPQPGEPVGPARVFGAGDGRLGVLVLPPGSLWAGAALGCLLGDEAGCRELPGPSFARFVGGICHGAVVPRLCCVRQCWHGSCKQWGSAPVSEQQPGMLLAAPSALPAAPQGGSAASTSR